MSHECRVLGRATQFWKMKDFQPFSQIYVYPAKDILIPPASARECFVLVLQRFIGLPMERRDYSDIERIGDFTIISTDYLAFRTRGNVNPTLKWSIIHCHSDPIQALSFTVTPVRVPIYSDSFLVPKNTFLYWKSSDRVTIADSDTFLVSQHCHHNQ